MTISTEAILEQRIALLRNHGFDLVPLSARQRTLRNRLLVRPDVDLSRFRISAKVDTVELRAVTSKSYRGGVLNKLITGKTKFTSLSATACGATPDRFGHEWVLKIQDPTPEQLRAIHHSDLWSAPPLLDRVDVAIDFFPVSSINGSLDAARRTLLDLLARHVLIKPEYTRRAQNLRWFAYRPLRDGSHKPTARKPDDDHYNLVSEGAHLFFPSTTYVGEKKGLELRLYIKMRDRVGGKAEVALPADGQAVRYEISFAGYVLAKIGLGRLPDLLKFDFQNVAKASSFRLLTVPAQPTEASVNRLVRARIAQRALEDFLPGGISHFAQVRGHSKQRRAVPARKRRVGKTIAFVELNKRVNAALRRLTREFRAKRAA